MNAMIVRSCQHTRKTLLIPSTAGYPSIICAECGATIITVAEAESFVAACHAREGRNLVRELHEAARAIAYRGTVPSNGLLDAAAIEIATLYRARLAAREKPEDCLPAGWCVSGAVNQVGCDSPYSITLLKLDGSGETVRYTRATPAGAGAEGANGARALPFDRETLGRMVREAWVRWARTQPNPKPHWLLPFDELAEPDKEADRQIGEAIARWTLIGDSASAATPPAEARDLVERVRDAIDFVDERWSNDFGKTAIAEVRKEVEKRMAALPAAPEVQG